MDWLHLGWCLYGGHGIDGTNVRYDKLRPSYLEHTLTNLRWTIPLGLRICATSGAATTILLRWMAGCPRISGRNHDRCLCSCHHDPRSHHSELPKLRPGKMAWNTDGDGYHSLRGPLQYFSGKTPAAGRRYHLSGPYYRILCYLGPSMGLGTADPKFGRVDVVCGWRLLGKQ